jgi:hypothetical protein
MTDRDRVDGVVGTALYAPVTEVLDLPAHQPYLDGEGVPNGASLVSEPCPGPRVCGRVKL